MADELVTVGNFQFPAEAEAARMYLEREGIAAFLADAETVNMDWLLGNAVGYIKLQVPGAQADAALAALERAHERRGEPEEGEAACAVECLECGANFPLSAPVCPVCGWSVEGEEDEPRPAVAAGAEEPAGAMDTLREMRRPLFTLMLWPMFFGIGLLAFAVVAGLAKALVP